jgi:eukaryotic-like serine/threonine-protein kinase
MKCLEKDRNRRYESVNGLAMDVRRHLDNEPVTARPPTGAYRLQKLVRRHKLAFVAGAAVFPALLGAIAVSTWQAVRAIRAEQAQSHLRQVAEVEKKKAQTEAAKATAISGFLQQLLGSADPDALKGSDYTVRELLDDFSTSRATQLEGQPEVGATVRATVGRAYRRLGVLGKALEHHQHHQRAVALRRQVAGQDAEPSLVECAWVFHEQGLFAKADPMLQEALDIYRTRGTSGQPIIYALWTLQRNLSLQERIAESERAVEEAVAIAAKSPHLDFPELANMIHAMAE